ncbi:hypothetical protein [Pseudomonas gingeri]|uniref:hypothetical protein n=1 Tax=Pseudomonas gingeri TaxID=117681 RepID=UPI0015A04AF0|nr:hypothetical protein [Pseudomonas gingeri]NWA11918.1 hypothetical protein [Pseudomonas gingeri]
MNINLSEKGDQLPTDVVIRWVNRSDLTPIPRNLEFTVKLIEGVEAKLKRGAIVWSGRENLPYKIVKTEKAPPIGEIQGKSQQQAMSITALLASCSPLAEPLAQAVVMRDAAFSNALRSCGAFLRIGSDFSIPRFTCLRGRQPSFSVARVLQEEGAALVLINGQLQVMRLTDIAKQAPVDDIGQVDASAKIDSEFLELMQIPSYYSVDDSGAIVSGQMGESRVVRYMPRGDARQLRNASCVLVHSKTVDSQQCQQIQAGNVLTVGGENLVVITAAHAAIQKTGAMESYSKLWMGKVVNAT